jgi:hypothetical protein
MTRLRDGRSGFESRQEQKIFLFSKPSRPAVGAHLTSCSVGIVFFPGKTGRGVMLNNHLLLVPRLRMSRVIPLLPPYTFMTLSGTTFPLLFSISFGWIRIWCVFICEYFASQKFTTFGGWIFPSSVKCRGVCFHSGKEFFPIESQQA